MKTTSPSLKFFQPAVAVVVSIIIVWGLSVRPAQANSYVVTLKQVGSNVVATGSGAIDLAGLSPNGVFPFDAAINPTFAVLIIAPGISAVYQFVSGPTSFGPGSPGGNTVLGGFGSGPAVGIGGFQSLVFVPLNYTSNTPLGISTSEYDNATFSSLGVTPGTYVWSWGTAADQKFTLKIGAAGVPETGSTFGLLFLALTALFAANRLHSFRLA